MWKLILAHPTKGFTLREDLLKCIVHILSSEILMENEALEKASLFTLHAVALIHKFITERDARFKISTITDLRDPYPLFYNAVAQMLN